MQPVSASFVVFFSLKPSLSFFFAAYALVLFFNFISAMALLISGAEKIHDGETFGLSILYLLANVPLSFIGWYRSAYNALK